MCLLCFEYQKEKMTYKELTKAVQELIATAKTPEELIHYIELNEAITYDYYFKD